MKPMDVEKAKIILFEIKEIFDKLGIEFWLHQGVCLGAYRDKNFAKGDKDIDLGVKHEILVPRIEQLKTVFQEYGYKVSPKSTPFKYERAISVRKSSIHVDIPDFALNGLDRFCACTFKDRCMVHKASLFENMATINFLGEEFLIPTPVEEYLEAEYGKTWRISRPDFPLKEYHAIIYGYWLKTSFGKNQNEK